MMLSRVLAVADKELRQARRDPITLAMLIGMPALFLLLYGYALNFDVRHVPIGVMDLDKSARSRGLVASFVNSTYFDQIADLPAGTDVGGFFQRRRGKGVLVIPDDFARELDSGSEAKVQLLIDGADAQTATTMLGYATALVSGENVSLVAERIGSVDPPIEFRPRVWYNPELRSTNFLVPGLVGFILMLTGVLSTAISIVREKERGTLEQLRVTPLGAGELVAGKTLPYLLISLIAATVILGAARLLFGIEIQGSYLDLFIVTLVYLIGALGLGILVSSIVDTQALAFQAGALLSMLPAIFLSGFIFPIHAMPEVLQAITYAFPTRYFLVIVRGVILKGASLGVYWEPFLFLVLYSSLVFAFAWLRLTRREA
jgi:ABC-2 type transport system permease protein